MNGPYIKPSYGSFRSRIRKHSTSVLGRTEESRIIAAGLTTLYSYLVNRSISSIKGKSNFIQFHSCITFKRSK